MIPITPANPAIVSGRNERVAAPYSCIAITPKATASATIGQPPTTTARIAIRISGAATRTRPTRPLTVCQTAVGASRRR